jgi:homeobox protein cut-like
LFTKDFRKLSDEERMKTFGSLLKRYQEEIDRLTKTAKASETAFLGVYSLLANAPDPIPGIQSALVSTQ